MTILIIVGIWSFIVVGLIQVFRYVHDCDRSMHAMMTTPRTQLNSRVGTNKHKQIHKQRRGGRAGYFKPSTAGSPGAFNISHL